MPGRAGGAFHGVMARTAWLFAATRRSTGHRARRKHHSRKYVCGSVRTGNPVCPCAVDRLRKRNICDVPAAAGARGVRRGAACRQGLTDVNRVHSVCGTIRDRKCAGKFYIEAVCTGGEEKSAKQVRRGSAPAIFCIAPQPVVRLRGVFSGTGTVGTAGQTGLRRMRTSPRCAAGKKQVMKKGRLSAPVMLFFTAQCGFAASGYTHRVWRCRVPAQVP